MARLCWDTVRANPSGSIPALAASSSMDPAFLRPTLRNASA
ncbi:Uncharacterised protein [Mycobacteroides abscessus subsp. abscessus]|nr:Uncharacterised protein [Mycobacteroides abscessus subsp. abscessus]